MPTNQEDRFDGSPQFGSNVSNASRTGTGNGGATGDPSVLGGIQQRVTSRVDEQKNRAADGLGGIADVFRNASNELRSDNETLASYVDMAGDQMRRLADHIRQRGVADMIDDVHAFARRRPALFIGGAFLVGLGVARFVKSSADRSSLRTYDRFSDVDPMTAGAGSPSYSGDLGEIGGY
jgi:hypothetical protein